MRAQGGRSVAVVGLGVLALSLALWLGANASDNVVQANHSTVSVSVDTVTTGNVALALGGTTESCRVVNPGQTVDVDLIITGLSDLGSFETYIKYDTNKIEITAPGDDGQGNNSRFMLQQAQPTPPGNNLNNVSETLPDTENPGIYRVGAADFNSIPGSEDPDPITHTHKDGVLVRLSVKGNTGASGFSVLQISPITTGAGLVGTTLINSSGNIFGDGADGDPFVDNAFNGGIKVATSGACGTDTDGDAVPDEFDNCDNNQNTDQANFDGDASGDVCDTDDDGDGLLDTNEPATCTAPPPAHAGRLDPDCDDDLRSDGNLDPDGAGPILLGPDNCISVANPTQANADGDAFGDACDLDDDNDGVSDASDNCPLVANSSQANYDQGWGDTQGGDACDPEFDGDGFTNAAEANVGTMSTPDHCGNLVSIPGHPSFTTSSAWPADLRSGPDSFSLHKINVQDISTFVTPVRHINTNPGDPGYNVRWDLVPGTTFGKRINVQDMATITAGSTSFPIMFGGVRAFGGPACSPP
jgi:hypothetical protein